MENLNSYALKLKLKRHKIAYELSEDEKSLQLGKAKIELIHWIGMIIFPSSLSIISSYLFISGLLPMIKLLAFFLVVLPTLYGFFGIGMILKRKKNNKNIKLFYQGKIVIISNGNEQVFTLDEIRDLDFSIEAGENELLSGVLYLIDNNLKKYPLIGIWDEDRKYLVGDLNYLRKHFMMLVGL